VKIIKERKALQILDMISGRLAGGQISNSLPFHLIISTVRRKKLMGNYYFIFIN